MNHTTHLNIEQIWREALIRMFTDPIMVGLFSLLFFTLIFCLLYTLLKHRKFMERMRQLEAGEAELTAAEFLKMSRARGGLDFTGCYILHNVSEDIFYVGQAKSVMKRVTQHLTGRGNGDIYADYKYGDEFTVKTITLAKSGYSSLNALERDLIASHDAFKKGYNQTRGNRN